MSGGERKAFSAVLRVNTVTTGKILACRVCYGAAEARRTSKETHRSWFRARVSLRVGSASIDCARERGKLIANKKKVQELGAKIRREVL